MYNSSGLNALKINQVSITISRSFLRSAGFGILSVKLLRKQAFRLDNLCMTKFYGDRKEEKILTFHIKVNKVFKIT